MATTVMALNASGMCTALSAAGTRSVLGQNGFRGTPFAIPSLSKSGRSITRAAPRSRMVEDDPFAMVKQYVRKTKVDITQQDVESNQASNESEKQSVFGAVPTSGGSFPRPETERRPELGNTSLGSIMMFDGPGPETINGRLAMVGFFWALLTEYFTHKPIAEQIRPGEPGYFWTYAIGQFIIFGSLVTIFKGESPDSRSNGPWNAQAERWNGRTAMIGFAGLLLWELATGKAFLTSVWPL